MNHKAILGVIISLAISVPLAAHAQDEPPSRLPLVPVDTDDPILRPMFQGMIDRGGKPANMHRTVGNAPAIFKEYVDLAYAIRRDAITPRLDREVMIMRAAQLANGEYEFLAHKAMALGCGLTEEQANAMENWQDSDLFDERHRAILAYADGLASPDSVDDETFDALAKHYNPQEIVELTMTANFYTAAARLTNALKVRPDADIEKLSKLQSCSG